MDLCALLKRWFRFMRAHAPGVPGYVLGYDIGCLLRFPTGSPSLDFTVFLNEYAVELVDGDVGVEVHIPLLEQVPDAALVESVHGAA